MNDKSQPQIKRTLHYRDYTIDSPMSLFSKKKRTHRLEIYWTPRDEEWDEHILCTYDVPELYTIEPSFTGDEGNDGRMRVLLKIAFSTIRATVPRPDYDVELLILPVERETGDLHLSVISAGSQCDKTYEDLDFVKKELDRLIAAIEAN